MENRDKSKTKKVILNLRQIYNQLVLLTEDKDFFQFIEGQWEELDKGHTVHTLAQCKWNIKQYLQDKKLPQSWLMPIYTLIKDKKLDFPMDNSISLRVGSDEITTNTQNLLFIRDKKGHLSDELSVSIVITGKVSVNHIIQFITDNKKQIEYWQKVIGLPMYKNPNWHDIDLGLEIIRMKDVEGKTFPQIAEQLQQELNQENPDSDHTFDENTLKTIYDRYKKRLSPK